MESERFDSLTRTLSSRRATLTCLVGGLAALLGLGPEGTTAHNPLPACQKITDPNQRAKCRRRSRAHNRKRHSCRPASRAITCANRCDIRMQNNCRKAVNCTCPAGKLCLLNKSCSPTCAPGVFCQPGCICGIATTEDATVLHCSPIGISCEQAPQVCTSTAQCPAGQLCGRTACGPDGAPEGRCVPVCSV